MVSKIKSRILPKAFIDKKLHSLTGLWLVIFLIEHLLTNSQAALLIGRNGSGFVRMVQFLHDLPYLEVIEIALLAVPIIAHAIWGIQYLYTSKMNSHPTSGKSPAMQQYKRNHAYSWQRYTAWILLVGIVLHVIQMRFIDYPTTVREGIGKNFYMVKLNMDTGLYTVSTRLNTVLFDQKRINQEVMQLQNFLNSHPGESLYQSEENIVSDQFNSKLQNQLNFEQEKEQYIHFVHALKQKSIREDQVVAVTDSFGTAVLLTVRDTFKSPLMIALYTIFVISACYHAFNGLWTAGISWGITLTKRSQIFFSRFCIFLIILLACLGLAAIWGTYWINLRY